MHRFMATIAFSLFAAGLTQMLTSGLVAADPEEGLSRRESEETTRLIAAELPDWKIWKGREREVSLHLEPKSVLRWTNPANGRVFGDLYIWTAAGRPEVAMSLFKAWQPANGFHVELQSLSVSPLEAERRGKTIWQPLKAGLKIQDVPDAPAPADSAALRLAQMRRMANEFSADLTDFRQNGSGEKQPLRLLSQPLYRYQSTAPELMDGAMFGFVLGTDPEVFLLLEAARSNDGKSHWQFGIARMNDSPLAVKHRETVVWRGERLISRDELRDSYVLTKLPEAPPRQRN